MQITINNLSKQYAGGKFALRNIDLTINSGMFGLLGPNGAGKTTLIRILVTLLKPSEGKVKINELDLQKDRREIRKMIGYLPQDFATFSKLHVWEFLDYAGAMSGIKSRKKRMSEVDRLLEEVGLFDVRDRRADKLSGGMKRRLGIAQTLIGEPSVMIVDEPTVGLDPHERLRFRNLLADLSRKEMIIILSTHIVGDISSTCTDVALLNNGKISFNGSPDELVASAQGKVWRIVSSSLEMDSIRVKYPVISAVPAEEGFELRVVANEKPGPNAQVVEPNLEDAYIHFMQSTGYDMNLESGDNGW